MVQAGVFDLVQTMGRFGKRTAQLCAFMISLVLLSQPAQSASIFEQLNPDRAQEIRKKRQQRLASIGEAKSIRSRARIAAKKKRARIRATGGKLSGFFRYRAERPTLIRTVGFLNAFWDNVQSEEIESRCGAVNEPEIDTLPLQPVALRPTLSGFDGVCGIPPFNAEIINQKLGKGIRASRTIAKVVHDHYANFPNFIWLDEDGQPNPEAVEILDVLANAGKYGLDAMDYSVLRPRQHREFDTSGFADALRFELTLSARALQYLSDARHGVIIPERLSQYHDFSANKRNHTSLFAELIGASNPARLMVSAHPAMPEFEMLRKALLQLPTVSKDNNELEYRRKRIVASIERLRWHPHKLGDQYVFINQPAYSATLIRNDKPVFETPVIVGKPANQTNFFHDEIEYVEFNPYWGIPRSILVQKYLPKLQQNGSYFRQIGYEVKKLNGTRVASSSVDWSSVGDDFPFQVRQPPGKNNALGQLKIMFPNEHAIYMHDTPAKALFKKKQKTFSHGCVRLQKPKEMAAALLQMNLNQVDDLISAGENTRRDLNNSISVYVSYFTAWPGENGKIHHYDDIYGRDEALMAALDAERRMRRMH